MMAKTTGSAEPTMIPPQSGVTVRMYRPGGLGDCFLLAFRAKDGSGRYMLIDCGIFFATKGGSARMKKIAKDIAKATGNHLHVVVATHEHWDHVSGFGFAKKIFGKMQVDQVWVAWTEDPNNPLANELRNKRAASLKALTAAVAQMQSTEGVERLVGILDFHAGFDGALGASSTAGLMDHVRTELGPARYCRPGELPLTLPGVENARVFVLGPPEDRDLLTRSNPSPVDSEVYEQAFVLDEASAFYIAALAAAQDASLSPDQEELLNASYPFARSQRISLGEAEKHPQYGTFFKEHYGFAAGDEQGPGWRRIDVDWLGAAGRLALDLDNDTNNTCLVLGIELVESGKVLLFAADAQVGNWLSWPKVCWRLNEGGVETEITGADLIRRTALYKVGHHGSHNATLRALGLEIMQSPELVAMVPVDQEQAGQKKWAMPFPPLLERLEQKTGGRILRADTGLPEKPASVSAQEWRIFLDHTAIDSEPDALWVEYTVPG